MRAKSILLLILASSQLNASPVVSESDLEYLQKANQGSSNSIKRSTVTPTVDSAPKDAIVPLRAKSEPEQAATSPDAKQTSTTPQQAAIEVEWIGKDGKPLPKTEAEKEIQELKQRIRRIEAILKKNGLMPISDQGAPQ